MTKSTVALISLVVSNNKACFITGDLPEGRAEKDFPFMMDFIDDFSTKYSDSKA